jgi:hypothetical protein
VRSIERFMQSLCGFLIPLGRNDRKQ